MSTSVKWQRVSPIALIYFLFDSARHALSLWPVLVPMLIGGEGIRAFSFTYLLPAIIVIYLISVVLDYWFFRYSIESDCIQIHRGVLGRKRLTLYFERVQQADIVQPFYFRPFGLATLGLESAGSKNQEVDIPGLVYEHAEKIKTAILALQREVDIKQIDASNILIPEDEEKSLPTFDYQLRLPWQEVARYGLMVNGLLFIAPILAPFMQNLSPSMDDWTALVTESYLFSTLLSNVEQNNVVAGGLLIAAAIVIAVVVLFALSVVIGLINYWDYHLQRVGDQFTYRTGWGTVKTRGFKLHKLQQVIIVQGMIARLLKRYTVTVRKAGEGISSQDTSSGKRFIIPVLDANRLADINQQFSIPTVTWQHVSPVYILRGTVFYGTLLCLATAYLLLVMEKAILPALLIYPLMTLAMCRVWWCLGIYQDDNWLALRSGFIGSKVQWMPIGKAQATSLTQPPWLKPWQLANLTVWSADGRIHIPLIPIAVATDLRDMTLYRVVTFKGRWF